MKKKVIKPFDLEKAKAGAELCTRDGRPARIECWNVKNKFTILALVTLDDGSEDVYGYTNDGKILINDIDDNDLMLVEYEEEECQFKPFDKVLVRNTDYEDWRCSIFSHKDKDCERPFVCIAHRYPQCLPYEGNEHLLGTTNKPE